MYFGCIMYANDLILLSASVTDLQSMLNICDCAGTKLSINFNAEKSKWLIIGPNQTISPSSLSIGTMHLQWVQKINYLGVQLCCSKTFKVDFSETRRKFCVSVNSILSKCNLISDMYKLLLLESHCLPILVYAVESFNLPKS